MDLTTQELEDLDRKYSVLVKSGEKVIHKVKEKKDKLAGYRENDSISGEYAEVFNVGW